MRSKMHVMTVGVLALVVGVGAGLAHRPAEPAQQEVSADQAAEIARLKEEVERLKGMVPDQSHVMKDVGYHFSNLWFAGRSGNWPLAGFYLNETRSHLRWAVRVRPVRRTASGEVDLRSILDGVDRSLLTAVQKTIEAKDLAAFSKAYRDTLSGCYACHQASEKPYLRPRVPEAPEGKMIDFLPNPSGQ
jgi:hypothetical protein